ncbi:hypothetical protein AHAS_Ahas05G0302900 [Arachis hypogaea]
MKLCELKTNYSNGSRQEKYGMTNKPRGEREDAEPNDKRLNYEPPTDLLSKLSLVFEVKKSAKLPSKVQPIS